MSENNNVIPEEQIQEYQMEEELNRCEISYNVEKGLEDLTPRESLEIIANYILKLLKEKTL